MPIDADPGNVEETAIPVGYITERLRRCGAKNVILLLDACRNEGARDGQGIGSEVHSGMVTIASCSPSERSYEIAELEHGAFTYSLLEGLRLQGETNCATVERLDQHLRFRVPELCTKYRKPRQTPYTHAEPAEKLHLILVPKFATCRISARSSSTRCKPRQTANSKPQSNLVAGDCSIADRCAGARGDQADRPEAIGAVSPVSPGALKRQPGEKRSRRGGGPSPERSD